MESQEKIPLDEAVARELIPCSSCGATGADVRRVGRRKHLLCASCARRIAGWAWAVLGVLAAAILVLVLTLVLPRGPKGPTVQEREEQILREVTALSRAGNPGQAIRLLQRPLEQNPGSPFLHLARARALRQMGYYEVSIPSWQTALEGIPAAEGECRFSLGQALLRLGRATEALAHLDKPVPNSPLEAERPLVLAECLTELQRYEEALRILEGRPISFPVAFVRHRAYRYLGRRDDAEKTARALDELAERNPEARVAQALLQAVILREEGDFAGARKVLEAFRDHPRAMRSALLVGFEAGDAAALKEAGRKLAARDEAAPDAWGLGLWFVAMGHLLQGEREPARAAARDFLQRTDPGISALRMERLMMRHLTGELRDDELEAEAKSVADVWANDIYYYLALATGDRTWGEKARVTTAGRDMPYHAIQRLLKGPK